MLFSSLLQAIGIDIYPQQGTRPLQLLVTTSIDRDPHLVYQMEADRFAVTDRWGMYREFDPSGNWLHAKNCHYMNTKVGCPFQFTFAGCGCACPYMHARSYVLAKWLTEQARNPGVQEPPHWHYALHHKDAKGRLLTRGLPFVEGICVNPTRWGELNPNHQRRENKHQKNDAEGTPHANRCFRARDVTGP